MSANQLKIPSVPHTHIILIGAFTGVRTIQKIGKMCVKAVTTGRGCPSHQHGGLIMCHFFLNKSMRWLTLLLFPKVKEAEI